jgi:hypothetical protein
VVSFGRRGTNRRAARQAGFALVWAPPKWFTYCAMCADNISYSGVSVLGMTKVLCDALRLAFAGRSVLVKEMKNSN